MSNKTDKHLRGQLRQIVKEILPELLTEQLVEAINSKLNAKLQERLTKIDDRQSQIQSYIVRNAGVPTAPATKSEE